ncbi:unnamed protein product [Pleuronectes platessa]|uniref:Uncharacterized protein n=1 Tax=Pleuronectes platessa TaxID=8262 RepID=A0A9N7UF98_PLEPL|nr:unnamed protein product [Pleuronectes platessa]
MGLTPLSISRAPPVIAREIPPPPCRLVEVRETGSRTVCCRPTPTCLAEGMDEQRGAGCAMMPLEKSQHMVAGCKMPAVTAYTERLNGMEDGTVYRNICAEY